MWLKSPKSCQAWRILGLERVFVACRSFPRSFCFGFFVSPCHKNQSLSTNSPLRGACARTSASRSHEIAKLIKSDGGKTHTRREKAMLHMFSFIIIAHYHTKTSFFCRMNRLQETAPFGILHAAGSIRPWEWWNTSLLKVTRLISVLARQIYRLLRYLQAFTQLIRPWYSAPGQRYSLITRGSLNAEP